VCATSSRGRRWPASPYFRGADGHVRGSRRLVWFGAADVAVRAPWRHGMREACPLRASFLRLDGVRGRCPRLRWLTPFGREWTAGRKEAAGTARPTSSLGTAGAPGTVRPTFFGSDGRAKDGPAQHGRQLTLPGWLAGGRNSQMRLLTFWRFSRRKGRRLMWPGFGDPDAWSLFENWVERATSPFPAATCHRAERRVGSPPEQASGLFHRIRSYPTRS